MSARWLQQRALAEAKMFIQHNTERIAAVPSNIKPSAHLLKTYTGTYVAVSGIADER